MKNRMLSILSLIGGLSLVLIKTFSPTITERKIDPLSNNSSESISLSHPVSQIKISNEKLTYVGEEIVSQSLTDEIAKIEAQLNDMNAIDRLNDNIATQQERDRVGEQLRSLDRLRAMVLERELAAIETKVLELESSHSSRLKAYGIEQP